MTTGRSPPADRFEGAKTLQAEIAVMCNNGDLSARGKKFDHRKRQELSDHPCENITTGPLPQSL